MKGIVVAMSLVFVVAGCGGTDQNQAASSPTTSESKMELIGDRLFAIGTEMAPGTWRSAGRRDGQQCRWQRISDQDGADIADNTNPDGAQVVEILPGDKAFQTAGCQPWNKVG